MDADSEDDELSDPPTDLESPPPFFVEPHRQTAVQVVITSSKALQQQLVQERVQSRGGRDFRQRKPIQVHPYLLENEEYKRTVQSRGLIQAERTGKAVGHAVVCMRKRHLRAGKDGISRMTMERPCSRV